MPVTGHQELADREAAAIALEQAISVIEQAFPGQTFRSPSPLAEGTDRLAATLILPRPMWTLWSSLPLPVEVYRRDFASPDSQHTFDKLLEESQTTLHLQPAADRLAAYRELGYYLAGHCEMMLEVSGGLPVLARKRGLPQALVTPAGGRPGADSPTFERFPAPFKLRETSPHKGGA